MINNGATIKGANALVLGITFKENCPDIRNSRAIDIIREFETYHVNVDVYDPWASGDEVRHEYGLDLITSPDNLKNNYDAIVLAVSHKEFLTLDLETLKSDIGIVFDVKGLYNESQIDTRL